MLRRLGPADAPAYRALMLRAYADASEAFTSTVSEREALPPTWWEKRVSDAPDAPELVVGAFEGERLVGAAGLRFETRPRTRHKALLYGLYVDPSVRGRGVARALTEAVLAVAREAPETRVVQLRVMETNRRARRLYDSLGFRAFGTEPQAIRMNDGFVAIVHMWRGAEQLADD
ncbi:GNAT family N-acetyltransferase [Rubrivirga marina]|uniref:N-acetyltransferase domain-containing protein n=1 Tax=Rubrivirga marina TaxID=1196024 RepID=A0A271IZM2_9BACT|nr:GNAT family N-acetyltransferase [Rubrivirga marina]PAP76681.1 hypothetical protein BSZ37_09630 [Rubrivirga marina]